MIMECGRFGSLLACLGRKTSEVKSVSLLEHLLRDFSVHLASDEHEDVDVERGRGNFSNSYMGITLTPVQVPWSSRREHQWSRTFTTLFKQALVFLVVSVVPINDK